MGFTLPAIVGEGLFELIFGPYPLGFHFIRDFRFVERFEFRDRLFVLSASGSSLPFANTQMCTKLGNILKKATIATQPFEI